VWLRVKEKRQGKDFHMMGGQSSHRIWGEGKSKRRKKEVKVQAWKVVVC